MYKLDAKDRKILYLLHKNCRLSNAQISRMVGLSKDGVKYKINRFVKDGLIKSFFLNMRTIAQGYATYVVYLRLRKVSSQGQKEIIDKLVKKKYIIFCASCFGKWDISLQISTRSVFNFEKYMDEISSLLGSQLSDYQTFISIKEYKVYSNTIDEYFGKIRLSYKTGLKPFKKLKLDDLDKKIFSLLAEDARVPLYIMSRKLNKSLDVVRYRLKRLESHGYIYNYDIVLDHAKLGYSLNTLFLYVHNLTQEKEKQLKGFFQQHPNIRWAHKTTGRQVILVETLTNSQEIFQDLITTLKNKFSDIILSYDSVMEFDNYKDITLPDLDELD